MHKIQCSGSRQQLEPLLLNQKEWDQAQKLITSFLISIFCKFQVKVFNILPLTASEMETITV